MKILFVAHSYAPLNAISTYRVAHWIKYWLKNGHEVTLLTTKKYGFEGPLDLVLGGQEKLALVEIDYLPGWLGRKLSGVKTELSSEPVTHKAPSILSRIKSTLLKKLLFVAYFTLGSFLHPTMFWVKGANAAGRKLAREDEFDILVSSFGPLAVHLVARNIVKSKPGLKWVADYRDLWSLNHLPRRSSLLNKFERHLESKVLKSATYCTAVSTDLSGQMESEFSVKCIEIQNGYDPDEFSDLSLGYFPEYFDQKKTNIVYAGMIYPGRRDPTPLFKAIKKYNLETLVCVHFYGRKMGDLVEDVRRLGLENCVFFHGYRERQLVLKEMASADALLFLESGSADASGVLTGKLFEYLALRKPILALGIKKGFQSAKIIEEFGVGLVSEDKLDSIELFLRAPESYYSPNEKLLLSVRRDQQALEVINLKKYA